MQLTTVLPRLLIAALLVNVATAAVESYDDESPSPVPSGMPLPPSPPDDDESPSPVPSNPPKPPSYPQPNPAPAPGIAPRKAFCTSNLDFPGFDIYNAKGSPQDCAKMSRADPRVATFTWTSYQGGRCWFKGAATNWKPSPGAISCRYDGRTTNKIDSCDMPGNDFASKPYKSTLAQGNYVLLASLNKDKKDCTQHCLEDGRCYAVTWSDYNGGTCWLKSSPSACIKKGTYSYIMLRQWY